MSTLRTNILITGASSGLGEGMAREFARRGRNLALCARRGERLWALRDELLTAHPHIRVLVRELDVDDHQRVFEVFREFHDEIGGLDRVIVNAGIATSRRVGTGHFEGNLRTARTNFMGALAQCEAAIEIFREQNRGHLVAISSMSALRGLPKHLTVYGAAKAGLTLLTEGIRAELRHTPITTSTIFPGYVRTEMNDAVERKLPFEVDVPTAARKMVAAIEREPVRAFVPEWPWRLIGFALRHLPERVVARLV